MQRIEFRRKWLFLRFNEFQNRVQHIGELLVARINMAFDPFLDRWQHGENVIFFSPTKKLVCDETLHWRIRSRHYLINILAWHLVKCLDRLKNCFEPFISRFENNIVECFLADKVYDRFLQILEQLDQQVVILLRSKLNALIFRLCVIEVSIRSSKDFIEISHLEESRRRALRLRLLHFLWSTATHNKILILICQIWQT